ncbi:MAG: DUF2892 domain-containing protein [Candidatus Gracilibacteria bacterium]
MKKNVGTNDKLIRIFLSLIFIVLGYFWTYGFVQIVLLILALVLIVTTIFSYCPLYGIIKINTQNYKAKKTYLYIFIGVIILSLGAGIYASIFFTKKFFLEDFATINNDYKQLLFDSGKLKREESIKYYESFLKVYDNFEKKYSQYKPFVLKSDKELNKNLLEIRDILTKSKDLIYTGDLSVAHKNFEEVRTIFQNILKRNNFSMLNIALVDFHDVMEVLIDASDKKDLQKIIATYPEADTKLKDVENYLSNNADVKIIRANLENLVNNAKENTGADLSKLAQDLKASFIKVYLAN